MVQRVSLFVFCALATLGGVSEAARADFRMGGLVQSTPDSSLAAGPDIGTQMRSQRPVIASRNRPKPVIGFGRQVPLSFAVRQVVPKGVTVTFAETVDPDAVIVDWQGGRPWSEVLRALLRQSGLVVTFKPGAVVIEPGHG